MHAIPSREKLIALIIVLPSVAKAIQTDFNAPLSCYECNSFETELCTSPLKRYDRNIFITSCTETNDFKAQISDIPKLGPLYHPKKSEATQGHMLREVFRNWYPPPSGNDRFWGLPVSVWLDDWNYTLPHHQLESGLSSLRQRTAHEYYFCYIASSNERTYRGCTLTKLQDDHVCPAVEEYFNFTPVTCEYCRTQLCNKSVKNNDFAVIAIALFRIIIIHLQRFNVMQQG